MLYCFLLFIGAKQKTKEKINTTMMKIVRVMKGPRLPRMSNSKLCKEARWNVPKQILIKETLIFIHKTIQTSHRNRQKL